MGCFECSRFVGGRDVLGVSRKYDEFRFYNHFSRCLVQCVLDKAYHIGCDMMVHKRVL
jgi:hypothetical protein